MTQKPVCWHHPFRFLMIGVLAQLFVEIALSPLPASAQLRPIPDTTLGNERSLVSPDTVIKGIPSNQIDGGARRGATLFHSFSQFNIDTGRGVYFTDPAGVTNILTRVTGGNPSQILGTLGVLGTANLFLLNPNGILFGPNARLDVGGSFIATTASSFKFSDGSEFSATSPQTPPLLTITITPGLQYGPSRPGATIANRGNLTTGQDLTLTADQVDLQGQLRAGRDLTLQAQNIVQIRDTATAPFLAQSSRDLTIQGNQGIDVLALQHPQSSIQSGRNLSLISDGVISGDGHFVSDAEFQIRSLSGQLGNFTSLYDPVISSAGDVNIAAAYTGASLLIESQGSVRIQGAVTINAPDTVSTFMGSDAVLSSQPGLIIRSGQSNLIYGGNQTNPPAFTNGTVPAGITLDNPVRVQPNATGGIVKLTADNGGITFNSIDASSTTGGKGSDITLTAQGTITNTGSFNDPFLGGTTALASFSSSAAGAAGDGGNISLTSTQGNIVLNDGGASSYSLPASGNGGIGGAISFSTNSGNISLSNSPLDSSSFILNGPGRGGIGGAISFSTNSGHISLFNSAVYSDSFPVSGNGGTGGAISFSTNSGNISLSSDSSSDSNLYSYAFSFGSAGKGGAISFSTNSGNISLSDLFLNSRSVSLLSGDSGEGGAISFSTNSGNISFSNSQVYSNSGTAYYLNSGAASISGNGGMGGTISVVTHSGNVILISSNLTSASFTVKPQNVLGNAGTGGTIFISARGGAIVGSGSTLDSFAVSTQGGSSEGGTVILEAGSGISGLTINTVASGGQSGAVKIHGFGNLLIDSTNIKTAQTVEVCEFTPCPPSEPTLVPLNGRGQAGNVTVDSIGNLTFSNSVIQSDTRGGNPAGNIAITSPGAVTFTNSQITSNTSGIGNAGDININAPIVNLTAQSQIQAQTTPESSGRGGSITITAPTSVNLTRTADGNPVISVKTNGAGTPGDITINTPSLTLSDAAEITATATATATNPQGGGSVTLNASNLNLSGIVGVFAETQGQSPAGTLRLNPYTNQPSLNIALTPNSQISASTSGSGNGGDLIATAPQSITIAGPGKLAVETSSTGNAGNMTFTTQQLTLKDGVEVSASTSSSGKAGDIGINAQSLTVSNGAKISTNTSSSGQAGDLTVNLTDQLTLTGKGSGLFASTTPGSTGNGGNIRVDPRQVLIQDGATIAVNSQGSGTGGNIFLQSDLLNLLDQSSITAETASAQGGNITLNVRDLLLMRRNSLISATAGTTQAGGDGGNITINAAKGFLVTAPNENNDIIANAFSGRGGNVTINATGIYWFIPRSRDDLERSLGTTDPTKLNPRLLPTNDITAISQGSPTLNGSVILNTPNLDPSRGLAQLPVDLTDASRLIVQTCPTGDTLAKPPNEFIITGRGGIPPTPSEAIDRDAIQVDLVTTTPAPVPASSNRDREPSLPVTYDPILAPNAPIVEAQAVQVAADGTVSLVAAAPYNPIADFLNHLTHCH